MSLHKSKMRRTESSDTCEDLAQRNENVRSCLRPDVDGGDPGIASSSFISTWTSLVDVVLKDSSPDHGTGTCEEAKCHTIKRREVDAQFAKEWVDNQVADWDKDEESEWVEVGEDVVGEAVGGERGSLRDEVVVQLVVSEPCRRTGLACG